MSSIGSTGINVTLSVYTVYDAVGVSGFAMQVTGGVYRTAPTAASNGEIQSIHMDSLGRQTIVGPVADDAAAAGNPVRVGGIYRATPSTYADLDQTTILTDANGRVVTADAGVAAFDKNVGDPGAATLRVQPAGAADDAAASGRPMRVGGIYRATPATYSDLDQTTLLTDSSGRLITADAGLAAFDKNVGDPGAATLRVVPSGAADDAAATGRPMRVGGIYRATPATYSDLDQTTLLTDSSGRLITADNEVASLSKNAGAVGAATLRVHATNEDIARSWVNQGVAADNAAVAGNPLLVAGRYESSLPTYDTGDAGNLHVDVGGRLIITFPQVMNAGLTAIKTEQATPAATTVKQAALSIGTTAVRLTHDAAAPSATRRYVAAEPDSASTARFFIGSSSVANSGGSRGIEIFPGQLWDRIDDAGDYYMISDTAAQTVYVTEQE